MSESNIPLKEHLNQSKVSKELQELVLLISELSKPISDAFHGKQGLAGTMNIYGEEQMKLDKWADQVICDKLKESSLVRTIASEEMESIVEFHNSKGLFGVVMDPLDGSSLIGVNLSVGTIIGIYDEGDAMEPGKKMDAALYLLYGPLTALVYSVGKGVHEFILDQDGTFRLRQENIKIPEGKIYAPGALRKEWTARHKKFTESLEDDGYKLRYSGAFVADFHQILHKGGVFSYPTTEKNPNGKLRLIFEANPMSFIVRQAGGSASNGKSPIHEIIPSELGQRVPLYIGSKKVIEKLELMEED